LRDYDALLRTGVPFEELVLWLGEPFSNEPYVESENAYTTTGASSMRIPCMTGGARWDCMKFELAYSEIAECERHPGFSNALFPPPMRQYAFTLRILLKCHANPLSDGRWVLSHLCLRHAVEGGAGLAELR
jgi:hypothetical protein